MIWRVRAEIFFTTAQRRTQFLNAYNSFKASAGTVVYEEVQSLDQDGGDPEAVPPIPPHATPNFLRLDVAFEPDQKNVDLFNQVKATTPSWIVYAEVSIHRCSIGTGNPPLPEGDPQYWRIGTVRP